MVDAGQALESAVERILRSESFRNAPTSRRLLKYLAERCAAGEVDAIKEYTIGVDAFNKAPGYDPRTDSTVRIQVGRLRQKLGEYYRSEGIADEFVVVLPKGRLTLVCEARAEAAEPVVAEPEVVARRSPWVWVSGALALALVAALVWRMGPASAGRGDWTPELEQMWNPLLHSPKPLLIAVGDPLFVQFENKALFRDPSIDRWEDLKNSAEVAAVGKAIGSGDGHEVHYYAAVGEVNAAFLLGRRLGPRQPLLSFARSSQMLWQQMADANVLFLGPPRFFANRLGNLPMSMEIAESADGFRVVHPAAGEPELYRYRDSAGYFAEDGEACVLVTRAAGPAGGTDIFSFTSNSTFGRLGAVDALTEPVRTKALVEKMRGPNGQLPRYFQLLLRVKYKGGVPTETSYLLHRELVRR